MASGSSSSPSSAASRRLHDPPGLDAAIRLATQAVHQDSAANYEEAARCYREAISIFRGAAKSDRLGVRVRNAIEDKCASYEERLRKLNRHLLSKADLSQLFRDCVNHELSRSKSKSRNSLDSSSCASPAAGSVDSEVLAENPYLKRGIDTVERAKRQDAR